MNTSPFGTLLVLLQERLKAKVPELRYIDQDLGQLELERPPVSFPCALIDFSDWQYEDLQMGKQFAQGTVSIRLGMQAWSNTNNLAPSEWRDKGLAFYDLEWQIFKALHSWKPEKYGYLMRSSVATEDREDNLRVRVLQFSCAFDDDGAAEPDDRAPLPPPKFTW